MIELYSSNHLVKEKGRRVSLDAAGVCTEIRACCVVAGMQDAWLADQMEMALDDFFMARAERSEDDPPAREEVDALVARLLLAAGYRDVAAEYGRRRHVRCLAVADSAPWDAARIRRLLGQSHALPEAAIEALAGQVGEKLEALALRQVSDRLITELAGHLVDLHAPPGPAIPGLLPPDSPWLLPADFWKNTVSGPARSLCVAGVLQPLAVTRLLPVPFVVLNLARLAESASGGPLTEMVLWSELQTATRAAHQVLAAMSALLVRVQPAAAGAVPRMVVTGFPALAVLMAPAPRKAQQQALMREIPERIRTILAQSGTPKALVYLQRPA